MTRAADVYSFAMIMWELYAGKFAFEGLNSTQASFIGSLAGDISGSQRSRKYFSVK